MSSAKRQPKSRSKAKRKPKPKERPATGYRVRQSLSPEQAGAQVIIDLVESKSFSLQRLEESLRSLVNIMLLVDKHHPQTLSMAAAVGIVALNAVEGHCPDPDLTKGISVLGHMMTALVFTNLLALGHEPTMVKTISTLVGAVMMGLTYLAHQRTKKKTDQYNQIKKYCHFLLDSGGFQKEALAFRMGVREGSAQQKRQDLDNLKLILKTRVNDTQSAETTTIQAQDNESPVVEYVDEVGEKPHNQKTMEGES